MADLTMESFCVRHPQNQAVGICDRCGKAFCAECRLEDVAAEKVYCSEECRDAEHMVEVDSRLTSDAELLEGYARPHKVGFRTWGRALGPLSVSIAPLAVAVAVLHSIWGTSEIRAMGFPPDGWLGNVYMVLVVYGAALVGVVLSRIHTGQTGDNPHIQALQQFFPWLMAWALIFGISIIGFILLVIPGIYWNLRVFWADEFALVHKANPFQAVEESWQVSRDQAGKTFGVEFVLGFTMILIVSPLIALYSGLTTFLPYTQFHEAVLAGVGVFLILIGYSAIHSVQIAFFYALRTMHARKPVDTEQKRMPQVLKWTGTVPGLLLIGLIGFDLLMGENIPSDRVLAGHAIPAAQYETLLSEGIVDEDEVVEYFFSQGFFSILGGGSVLTNRRVIAYGPAEVEGIHISAINIEDIASIEVVVQTEWSNYAIYEITSHDRESRLELQLPQSYGDAERFLAAIEMKRQD